VVIERTIPSAVFFLVGDKLHRGWEDDSGVFTLEKDNIDAARKAGNVIELDEGTSLSGYTNRCENCFRA